MILEISVTLIDSTVRTNGSGSSVCLKTTCYCPSPSESISSAQFKEDHDYDHIVGDGEYCNPSQWPGKNGCI